MPLTWLDCLNERMSQAFPARPLYATQIRARIHESLCVAIFLSCVILNSPIAQGAGRLPSVGVGLPEQGFGPNGDLPGHLRILAVKHLESKARSTPASAKPIIASTATSARGFSRPSAVTQPGRTLPLFQDDNLPLPSGIYRSTDAERRNSEPPRANSARYS